MKYINKVLDYVILDFGGYTVYVYQVLSFLALFVVTFFVVKLVKKLILLNAKNEHEIGTRTNVYRIVQYFLWTVSIVSGLEMLGFRITILFAGATALLVGFGLGVQHIFSDIVSGILMLVEGVIKVNQVIEVDNMVVRVQEINLRTSKVTTRDDVTIILPNHKFTSENVINWSADQGITRFYIKVGVSYDSDIDLVTSILLECMEEHDSISKSHNHKPLVKFMDFGDSSLVFDATFYSKNIFRIEQTQSEVRYSIFKKFKEAGIVIPFPQRDLHIKRSGLEGI